MVRDIIKKTTAISVASFGPILIAYLILHGVHGQPKKFRLLGSALAAAVPGRREVSQNIGCLCT